MDDTVVRAKAVEHALSLTMPMRANRELTMGTFLDIADAIAKFISYNEKGENVSQT